MTDPIGCPVPLAAEAPPSMRDALRKWELTALKWRNLAERRRVHHVELFESGRWRRYYSGEDFVTAMRDANAAAQRWSKIAPLPEERLPQPEAAPPPAAGRDRAA